MNGAHILSQLRNVPSHICDISTIDGCNFQSDTTRPSLFYFHPLIFFSPLHSLFTLFLFPPCPFLSFCSWLLPVISPSWLLPSAFLFFFTPFAILLIFFTFYISSLFFQLVLLICLSHFVAIFLFPGRLQSKLSLCLSWPPCILL